MAAGGLAALLAGRSGDTPAPAPKPVAQLETVDVLVARQDIVQGSAVTPSELRWQMWPAASAGTNFIRQTDRPNAIEELSGSIARASFATGEPIREARLIKAGASGYMAAILPSGMRAVSTEISAETSAGGFIIPGDHVDVILTQRDRAAEKATGTETFASETILSNIRVLAIDQSVEDQNGQKVVIGKTTTLELTPGQVETLALGRELGKLSLALRSIADTKKSAVDPDEDRQGRGGINMVRFGVTTPATTK